jgi:hypothetical protein
MEASMLGSFDRSRETNDNNIYRSWGIGIFVLPVILVAVLIEVAIIQPNMPNWISEAVQAEFAAANLGPEAAPAQLAQPAKEIRTVKAD